MRFPRSSGILLHPTSLPGPYGCGDFGDVSRHFIEWLIVAGQNIWQVLPLEPTGYGNSPYMALSAFAGNPLLIGMEGLISKGWLTQTDLTPIPGLEARKVDYAKVIPYRMLAIRRAAERFFELHHGPDEADFDSFCKEQETWLDEFALFKALEDYFGGLFFGIMFKQARPAFKCRSLKTSRFSWRPPTSLGQFTGYSACRKCFSIDFANRRGMARHAPTKRNYFWQPL